MGGLFSRNWDGDSFSLFDGTHIAFLVAVAVLTAATIIVGRRLSARTRKIVAWTAAAALLVNTIFWHIWNVAVGLWNVETMLPLHLCSVMVFVAIVALVTKNPFLAVATWLLGTPGALQAILTPEVAPYGFPHYRVLQSWSQHALLFIAGFWFVFVEGIRPTLRSTAKAWLGLHVLAAITFMINWAVGSNYLFLNGKPEFATVLDALPPWPGYLLILEAIVIVVMLLFWLIGRRWSSSPAAGSEDLQSGGRAPARA